MPKPVKPVFDALKLPQATSYVLGLSGGQDSAALAAALAGRVHLRCVHVNHALGPQAAALESAAVAVAKALQLPLIRVQLGPAPHGNLEAWAREQRYAQLAQLIVPGEVLLTAHHAQDQVETFLLAALRGSGNNGFAAMPVLKPFAQGWHARPALHLEPSALHPLAAKLPWVEDSSNADQRIARNHIRHAILPRLDQLHPRSRAALLHSVDLAQRQSRELVAWQQRWLRQHMETATQSLSLVALAELDAAARDGVLQQAVRRMGAPAIPGRVLQQWVAQMAAPEDRQPSLQWQGWSWRRYRDRLYLVPPLPPPPAERLLATQSWVDWVAGSRVYLPQPCRATLKGGSTTAASLGRKHRSGLRVKAAFSALGVPPWLRVYWPMLWHGDQLLSVAEWRVDGAFAEHQLRWSAIPAWMLPWVQQAREQTLG